MDETRNRKNKLTSYDDFMVGDLVTIDSRLVIVSHEKSVVNALLGVVAPLSKEAKRYGLFPQVAVFVFSKNAVELHWPSYLKIISPAKK